MTHPIVNAIVVAAGTGSRFGADMPKQFCLLAGKPVLMRTLQNLHDALPQARIYLVLSRAWIEHWHSECEKYRFDIPHTVIEGGATRWESVRNAVMAIDDTEGVTMIHDGARPLVKPEVAAALMDTLHDTSIHGAIPILPMTDSMRMISETSASSTEVDRSRYVRVQTPQAFPTHLIKSAYTLPFDNAFTDDASVMSRAGYTKIALVEGSEATIKITRPQDLLIARALM